MEKLYRLKWSQLDGLGALVISPTRELALQIFNELRKIGKRHEFSAGLMIGGKNLKEEQERVGGSSRNPDLSSCKREAPGRPLPLACPIPANVKDSKFSSKRFGLQTAEFRPLTLIILLASSVIFLQSHEKVFEGQFVTFGTTLLSHLQA